MKTTDSDPVLVALMARGDEEALAALYDRHSRTAYGLAVRVLRDPTLAEDAVQEAFLTLWRTAASFDPTRGSVSGWLHLLVHRRAVDLVRRSERQRAVQERPELIERGDAPGPEELAVGGETAARATAALRRLTSCQREVIELAFYDGLTQREIAEALDLPLGTVKSRTFAGLTRLRQLLEEDEGRAAAQTPLGPVADVVIRAASAARCAGISPTSAAT
ncbi:MAG: sigma-70 family RNA polymerase sigma factor [Gaiella sp.]